MWFWRKKKQFSECLKQLMKFSERMDVCTYIQLHICMYDLMHTDKDIKCMAGLLDHGSKSCEYNLPETREQ